MILEVLYPELTNLYGDKFNIKYISECVKNIKIIETHLGDEPAFLSDGVKPDLVYRGSMTEKAQIMIINELKKYKDEIKSTIDNGQRFLITGNAIEIFGNGIYDAEEQTLYDDFTGFIEGLGIFEFDTKRRMLDREASLYHGKFDDVDVIGYKASFSKICMGDELSAWIKTVKGPGMSDTYVDEGLHIKNFYATTLLGPLFVINPKFFKVFLSSFLEKDEFELKHEKESLRAFEIKMRTILDPNTTYKF